VEHAMADHRRRQGQGRDGVTSVPAIKTLSFSDAPWNMQWQTIAAGKAKDATDRLLAPRSASARRGGRSAPRPARLRDLGSGRRDSLRSRS
jgi:hypothetical protein